MIDEKLKEKLKAANIKYTEGIKQVMKSLSMFDNPVDITQIQNKIEKKIHLATVYRIFEKLEKAMIINRLQFNEQKSLYELNKAPHDHFICNNCNRVIDIFIDKNELRSAESSIGKRYKVKIQTSSINFIGKCKKC